MDNFKCTCGKEIVNYHGVYSGKGKQYLLYHCTKCKKDYLVDRQDRKKVMENVKFEEA